MIQEGWLCDLRINTVKTELDLGHLSVSSTTGDFIRSELSLKINTLERNQIIVQTYMKYSKLEKRSSTLVFAVDVQHIFDLTELFRQNEINAFGVHAGSDAKERADILERFRRREIPVVINCGILTEGVDIPSVDMILLGRPTKSGVLLQQMLGRGMRLFPGKDFCLALDFVDCFKNQSMQATIPTLLGLNSIHVFKGVSLKTFELPPEKTQPQNEPFDQNIGERSVKVTLVPFLDPFSLKALNEDRLFIRKLSQLCWARVAERKFILNVYPRTYISLEQAEKSRLWVGRLRQIVSTPNGYFHKDLNTETFNGGKVAISMTHDSLASALQSLDNLVRLRYGFTVFKNLNFNAQWRKSQATDKQISFLSSKGIAANLAIDKGTARDLIDRKRFGAAKAANIMKRVRKNAEKHSFKGLL